MNTLQWIFFVVIVFVSIVRASMLPVKQCILTVACWGIAAVSLTNYMSGLTPYEVEGIFFSKTLLTWEFLELLLFVVIVFSSGTVGRIIGYYPGVMILAPIALISAVASRSFPGIDFMIPALLTGASVCVVAASLVFLCHYLRLGKEGFYKISLIGIFICIIIYGMQ